MGQSLAVKHRPQTFEEVVAQKSIIKILQRQLELQAFTNVYLFAGPSGTGKTTLARIFANKINNGRGTPIEIDGASNNGVDNVRNIIDEAKTRSLDSTYKIFIIDEAHMITTAGWNAFLKCIEECPTYTIFMFCTTDPQKIPVTIINRTMRFNLSKVPTEDIKNRLDYICKQEGFTNYESSTDFIAKLSEGGMRDAIANLEKVANYSTDISIENVLECLGDFSYDTFFDLTGALINKDEEFVFTAIENYYNNGKDLKQFVEQYLSFTLDLTKYCLFKSMDMVKIPNNLKNRCEGYSNIPDILSYSNNLVNKILDIKNMIRYDMNIKNTVEAMMIALCR